MPLTMLTMLAWRLRRRRTSVARLKAAPVIRKGRPQPQAVNREQQGALAGGGAVAGQKEDARQDRTDAGNPPGAEADTHERAAEIAPAAFHPVQVGHAAFGVHQRIEKTQDVHQRGNGRIGRQLGVGLNSSDDPSQHAESRKPKDEKEDRTQTLNEWQILVQVLPNKPGGRAQQREDGAESQHEGQRMKKRTAATDRRCRSGSALWVGPYLSCAADILYHDSILLSAKYANLTLFPPRSLTAASII